ncbi:MAG TPA: hypothetical protein VGB53_14635 [Rubricoccaceae bacterium]|jgi:hypothetical protein
MTSPTRALLAGFTGASALTAVHQTARLVTADAPRMDLLGMRALARLFRAADATPPPHDPLYAATFVGDIAANTLYYALAGAAPGREWSLGLGLGLAAGVGAVVLPPRLGLGSAPSARTPATAAMTVAWYTIGGLAAAAAARRLRRA